MHRQLNRRHSTRGFTLLEVTIVATVVTAVGAAGATALFATVQENQTNAEVDRLRSVVDSARRQSIRSAKFIRIAATQNTLGVSDPNASCAVAPASAVTGFPGASTVGPPAPFCFDPIGRPVDESGVVQTSITVSYQPSRGGPARSFLVADDHADVVSRSANDNELPVAPAVDGVNPATLPAAPAWTQPGGCAILGAGLDVMCSTAVAGSDTYAGNGICLNGSTFVDVIPQTVNAQCAIFGSASWYYAGGDCCLVKTSKSLALCDRTLGPACP